MTCLIQATDEGLYCAAGGFHIDPWRPVRRAVITHAHADHARAGHGRYLTSSDGLHVLRLRMGPDAIIDTLPYGKSLRLGDVSVSFHPAGHILGSCQIRLASSREVCVVSGDYRIGSDETCAPFEPIPCDTFISECTFGLPIYRWPSPKEVFTQINHWWSTNLEAGRASIIFAYAMGKAQRILANINSSIGPIYCHGAVERVNAAYRATGVQLPDTVYAGTGQTKRDWATALIVAPPSAMGSPWMRRFGDASTAFASGWMRIRGMRRRRPVDRGFVLSDHADWTGLLSAMANSGASRILLTHGQTAPMIRWLREQGLAADALHTAFVAEPDDAEIDDAVANGEDGEAGGSNPL